MPGFVAYREDSAERPQFRRIGGVRFRMLYVPRGEGFRAESAARAAARRAQREGIARAVFPKDYPYRAAFARRGVLPPDAAALHLACAPALARRAMAQLGLRGEGARLALAGARAAAALCAAATALAPQVRYLTLCLGSGGEALARRLRAAAELRRPDETIHADLTLVFDDLPVAADGAVLPLVAAAAEYRLPEGLDPAGAGETELLAALFAAGALRPETLAVARVALPREGLDKR